MEVSILGAEVGRMGAVDILFQGAGSPMAYGVSLPQLLPLPLPRPNLII